MAFTLKPLPFPKDSLGPTMSARTLEHHHDKHHAAYVKKLNELIAGTKLESSELEAIIRATAGAETARSSKIFNNAAQTWNHDFFWESSRAQWRRHAAGAAAEAPRGELRLIRKLPRQVRRRSRQSIRQRLGVAGRARRASSQSPRRTMRTIR